MLAVLCASLLMVSASARTISWFNDKDLTLTGVYYYPEHWDESQWERDFKKMHELGFEFTHFAEFAGRNWNRKRDAMILHGWTGL